MPETLYDPDGIARYFIATDGESATIYELSGTPAFYINDGIFFAYEGGIPAYQVADDGTFWPYNRDLPALHGDSGLLEALKRTAGFPKGRTDETTGKAKSGGLDDASG